MNRSTLRGPRLRDVERRTVGLTPALRHFLRMSAGVAAITAGAILLIQWKVFRPWICVAIEWAFLPWVIWPRRRR